MATTQKPKKTKKSSWLDSFLQIFSVVFPLIMQAVIKEDSDKEPSMILVRSVEGIGNASVTTFDPSGKKSVAVVKAVD